MTNLSRPSRNSVQHRLRTLLTNEFHGSREAYDLFGELLRHKTYEKTFCLKLIDVARRKEAPWETRRLATLMAEHQLLKLHPDDLGEFDSIFTKLNLKEPGLEKAMAAAILKEGYSTTVLRDFIPEFRRKLSRLNRVHNRIRGGKTTELALREFIELSRRDCKLSLARYLFTADDVISEILEHLQVAEGIRDLDISQPVFVEAEITRYINLLPDFEAGILKRLCAGSKTYWVSNHTNSEINSLVEYPLTTVVLVIKPPGSEIEFEIKRAGRKGNHSLGVIYQRNGQAAPPSHRLDGGSMQWLLRYEAVNASKLSAIYRLVHDTDAPMPGYISRTTVFTVPTGNGRATAISYFTDPELFGEGYRQMRGAMQSAVKALQAEEGENLPPLPGDMALTAEFISHVAPAQAILSGTSSFRIDKLATYLSARGAERYFKDYRAVERDEEDERRFADELLEEVLGVSDPPDVPFENFEQYLEAAFRVVPNRARADQIFLSLVQQIARFWGTLLAIRGHSRGESLVARNVGLRSVWEKGAWRVKITFMDHDGMSLPELETGHFFAQTVLSGMLHDERHVWGRANPDLFPVSLVGYLQSIYRTGSELEAEAQSLAMTELKDVYRKTQQALLTNPKMRAFFSETFISRLFDWDKFACGYLQRSDKAVSRIWEKEMKEMLAAKGYEHDAFDYYMEAAEKHKGFLERNSFLYVGFNREADVAVNG